MKARADSPDAAIDPDGRGGLDTERRLTASSDLDRLSSSEAFDVFQAQDAGVAAAVGLAKADIVRAVELITARLARGGRLFYVGAGTSGRLGLLDAVECPPTFQSDPRMVRGLIAGGDEAFLQAVEGAEDDREAGAALVASEGIEAEDVLFGIAAGGTTPFVHGAIERARSRGAGTVFLACVPRREAPDEADVSIRILTGPEVLTGSTRLKAGTGTKMVLNRVSTLVMVRLGKVHGNLMVDLHASNAKLRARAMRILHELVGVSGAEAEQLLDAARGSVKLAALMHARGLALAEAESLLQARDGSLRRALES